MSEQPSTFDYALAKKLCMCSSVAYLSQESLLNWQGAYCSQLNQLTPLNYFLHPNTDARCYLAVDDIAKQIIVAFSGSATLKNFKVLPLLPLFP